MHMRMCDGPVLLLDTLAFLRFLRSVCYSLSVLGGELDICDVVE